MIEPLQDSHTGLEASDIGQEFDGWRTSPNHLDEGQWKIAQELIAARYVEGPLVSFCKGHVQFGMLKHSIGYLRITAFYDYVDAPTYGDRLHALNLALDSIFKSANRWNGIVIDVRQNNGGDDALGVALASRFSGSRYLAYKKVARESNNKQLRFTPAEEVWVEPSSRPEFHGRVVLLTGPDTVSAGETFAMALMGREFHVIRVGLNTQGVFSDVQNRSLPNGWRFRLPNEIYYTANGKSFDRVGVPPDVEVPFFSTEDIRAGRDSALQKALQTLTERR
jgi:C-terminal processing protease CtpA/Prc